MLVRITNVGKKFGEFAALKNINLEIAPGEFLAILGPSGCGKTTLLKLLAGFETPSTGVISIDETPVSSPEQVIPPAYRNIGMVFQSFALWPHLTVLEHITFALRHHRFVPLAYRRNAEQRAREVLKIVNLADLASRFPDQLSGGQKQRVALARALAPAPSLLLMDEPLSSLDAELRVEMRREIQNIRQFTNATIVFVTHDQEEALAMADRIIVMNQGCIEQNDSPLAIYTNPATEFVAKFVGKANLVQGRWQDERFYPNLGNGALVWSAKQVAGEFRHKNLYPVRPEEFYLAKDGPGIPGVIKNILYQGKETHYVIGINQAEWQVNMKSTFGFKCGDPVVLQLITE